MLHHSVIVQKLPKQHFSDVAADCRHYTYAPDLGHQAIDAVSVVFAAAVPTTEGDHVVEPCKN
jgi:hypothetical protein